MKLSARNYRIIESADIEVDGLTIIRGQNDNGKSCLMRGLRTLVQNASSDSQIRYGASEFSVRVELPANDRRPARSAEMRRARKGSPVLYVDNGPPVEKLGRSSLCELDPSFPLRVIPFADEKFLPNFVFQRQVPVFGQADIYAFFASMFEPVAQVSRHLLKVRKRSSEATSETAKARAQLESYNQLLVDYQLHLDEFDVVQVTQDHAILEQNRSQVAEYNRMYTEHQKVQQALESMAPYQELLDTNLDALDSRIIAIAALQEAFADVDTARDALARADALVIQGERAAAILEGLPPTAIADLDAAQAALLARDKSVETLSKTSGALSRIQEIETLTAGISQGAFHDLSQAVDSCLRYRDSESRLAQAGRKLEAIAQMEPVLQAGGAHRQLLQAQRDLLAAEARLAESDRIIQGCFDELRDVVSCPVCGHDLDRPILDIVGERR